MSDNSGHAVFWTDENGVVRASIGDRRSKSTATASFPPSAFALHDEYGEPDGVDTVAMLAAVYRWADMLSAVTYEWLVEPRRD